VAAVLSTILALLSGLIGAVIGGLIAGRYSKEGSLEGARIAAEHADDLFSKERESRETERRKEVKSSILSELRFNAEVLTKPQVDESHATLAVDSWLSARGQMGFLGDAVVRKLLMTYAEVGRYNDAVHYELHKVPLGNGVMNRNLQSQRERIQPLIEESVHLLEKC
jgi:hypothetical protein